MESVRQAGGKPYPIPAGCSEHRFGGPGFVGFAADVRADRVIGIDASAKPE